MTRSRSKPVGPLYRELLIEIGCEELPASWLPSLTRQIGERVGAQLAAVRLDCPNSPEPFGTPRRLTVRVAKVADRQTDLEETLTGPPVLYGRTGTFDDPDSLVPEDLRKGNQRCHRVIVVAVEENLFVIAAAEPAKTGPYEQPIVGR